VLKPGGERMNCFAGISMMVS